jgi:hypothetical protein
MSALAVILDAYIVAMAVVVGTNAATFAGRAWGMLAVLVAGLHGARVAWVAGWLR